MEEGDSDENGVEDKFFKKIPSINEEKSIFWSQFHHEFHHESSNMCSMVSIKDSDDSSIVFPPINHENLRTPSSVLYNPPFSSSSSSLSDLSVENDAHSSDSTFSSHSSSPDEFVTKVVPEWGVSRFRGIGQWVNLGLGVVCSKMKVGFLSIQSSSSTVRSPAVVAVVMGFLYIGIRRLMRRRRSNESRNHLHRVIREKEERIHALLQQIAQMNKLLVSTPPS